jgi:hypothetical protein
MATIWLAPHAEARRSGHRPMGFAATARGSQADRAAMIPTAPQTEAENATVRAELGTGCLATHTTATMLVARTMVNVLEHVHLGEQEKNA